MKVYVVQKYLNDYPENGGGFQGVDCIFDSKEKAEEYCNLNCFFEDYKTDDGKIYYRWFECEVK